MDVVGWVLHDPVEKPVKRIWEHDMHGAPELFR